MALVVIAAFFLMVRPVREIQDIAYNGQFVYLALGKQGIRVLDIGTNPTRPREVGSYNTFGTAKALDLRASGDKTYLYVADGKSGISVFEVETNGSVHFLWSDKRFSDAVDIAVKGKFAYVARGKKGLTVVNVDSGSSGSNSEYWQVNGIPTVGKLVVEDNRAYVVDLAWQLHILNINQPQNVEIIQSIPIGGPVNDMVVTGGTAYLATEGGGLILFNTYAPPDNAFIGEYSGFQSVKSVVVQGAFAFVSGGTKGIHALEISRPWEIVKVGEFTRAVVGEIEPLQVREDNGGNLDEITTQIDAGKLFQVGNTIYYSDGLKGLRTLSTQQVIDVRIPKSFGTAGMEEGWVEDVAIVKRGGGEGKNYAYLAGGDRGLWIIDITNKSTPQGIPYLDSIEGDVFNRLMGYANAVAVHGEYAYVAYKTRGVQIFQVSDPEHPTALTPIGLDGETHDLTISDDKYLYVAAGSNGFRIIDVEQKVMANLIGSEDTPGNAVSVSVFDNHAYVADSGSGLQIINILDRQKPTLIASRDTVGEARGVTIYKHKTDQDVLDKLYAYVADGSGGVAVFEVTNPQDPRAITIIETVEFAQDVEIQQDRLYVSERSEGLVIYDLANPENPVRLGSHDTPGKASRVTVDGEFVYIADLNRGLRIINVANSLDPREVGFFDLPTQVKDLVIAGNGYAYLVDGVAGMWTVSLSDLRNPIPVNFLDTPGEPSGINLGVDGRLYIADGSKGLHVVDISANPINPTIIATYDSLKDVRNVRFKDGFAYVADGKWGLPVLAISDLSNITQTSYFGTDGIALNVDIAGNYAYIVTTQGKIDIANIGFPGLLPEVQPIPPMNSILVDTQNVLVVPGREHAYVSDGVNGLVVFDVSQPYRPEKVFQLDTPGKLMDLAITQHYAFLADGRGGVGLIYMPRRNNMQTHPDWYASFGEGADSDFVSGCDLNALSIEVIPHVVQWKGSGDRDFENYPLDQLLRYYAYVATDQCGLKTLEYTILMDFGQGSSYFPPGEATFGMVVKGYLGVLKATLLGLWDKRSQGEISFLDVPATARLIAAGNIRALDPRVKNTAWMYLFGTFLLAVGILYWMALVAHFILPVRDPKSGWMSFLRLFLYFRGMHGPIVTAREGVGKITPLEPDQPGIALVDLNSAIVTEEYPAKGTIASITQSKILKKRKETGETLYQARAKGPGVVFLRAFERVRGVADLRPQIRLRINVATQTRDGIEVESMVFALFTLGQTPEVLKITYVGDPTPENIRVINIHDKGVEIPGKPGKERLIKIVGAISDELDIDDKKEIHRFIQKYKDNQLDMHLPSDSFERSQVGPYIFDAHRVFDAIVSKPYDVDDKETKEWTELPAHVAAGIYRNLVSQEYYDNLYKSTDPKEYPILELKHKFMVEMRNQGVLAYQYCENLDGSPFVINQVWNDGEVKMSPVREFRTPKPLRVRGIKVIAAGFGELRPTHEDVSQYLTRYWQSEWQRQAMIKQSEYDLEALRLKNMARIEAQSDIVKSLSMIMNNSAYSREALAYRTLQALEAAAADPRTRSLVPGETIRMLERIHDLLLSDSGPTLDAGQEMSNEDDQGDVVTGSEPDDADDSSGIEDQKPNEEMVHPVDVVEGTMNLGDQPADVGEGEGDPTREGNQPVLNGQDPGTFDDRESPQDQSQPQEGETSLSSPGDDDQYQDVENSQNEGDVRTTFSGSQRDPYDTEPRDLDRDTLDTTGNDTVFGPQGN